MDEKAYKIIADVSKMSHDQWLELRKFSIGGSDVAAAIGASRWKSRFELWAEKTGRLTNTVRSNESMYWGTIMEPIIRREFAKRTGLPVSEAKYIFASAKYDFLTANLDGYVKTDDGYAVLELKTAGNYAESDWLNGVPVEYFCQVQHYLFVTGLQKAFIAVLLGGNKFQYKEIARDEDTIQTMVKLCCDFWNHVKSDTPPAVTEQDNEVLSALYPRSNAQSIELPAAAKGTLSKLIEAKAKMAAAKKEKDLAEAEIKSMMKNCELAHLDGYILSWKSSQRNSFNAEKARELLTAEQVEKCMTTSESRIFRISKKKTK